MMQDRTPTTERVHRQSGTGVHIADQPNPFVYSSSRSAACKVLDKTVLKLATHVLGIKIEEKWKNEGTGYG
jgi:hypothetical protein